MPDDEPAAPAPGGARTTRRRGRLSAAHRAALVDHAPAWALQGDGRWSRAGLDAAFGRRAPRLLDVGVGSGTATVDWAQGLTDHDAVAVELHRPGLGRLFTALAAGAAPNVRVAEEDVTVVLAAVEPGAFDAVRVLFPDPWPKRRHVERRLVDERFVTRVADLLPACGSLHVATDWAEYADQVRAVIAAEPRLVPVADGPGHGEGWTSIRPERTETIYEARGVAAGRRITDLVALRG